MMNFDELKKLNPRAAEGWAKMFAGAGWLDGVHSMTKNWSVDHDELIGWAERYDEEGRLLRRVEFVWNVTSWFPR